jgi:hypothetical protein
MSTAMVSRLMLWRARIRTTSLGPRLAIGLWVVLAFVVWNVVFDRVLVLAGRRYVYAAAMAARQSDAFLRIDDFMKPAVSRGVWLATATGCAIVAVGIAGTIVAVRRRKR